MELLIGIPVALVGLVLWLVGTFALADFTIDSDHNIIVFALCFAGIFIWFGGFPFLWAFITFLLITYPAILLFPLGIGLTAGAAYVHNKVRPEPEEPKTLEYYTRQKKLDAAKAIEDWENKAAALLEEAGVPCSCRYKTYREFDPDWGTHARRVRIFSSTCPVHSWGKTELAWIGKR